MAYVDTTIERQNYLYTFKRASLLAEIFYDNIRLTKEIYPFDGVHDTYDVLLSEQYTLYDGGEPAVDHAKDMLQQMDDLKEEFADDEEVLELIDMLADEYEEYVTCFVDKFADKKGE